MTLRSAMTVLLLGLVTVHGSAQVEQSAQARRVTAAAAGPVSVAAGRSTTVDLPFRVKAGYHINSNKPNSELLVPTVLSTSPPTNIFIGKITYPAGEERSFSFAPQDSLSVYSGDFTLNALVRAAQTTPPGTYRVRGSLKYQACDDRACYPPSQVPVAFDVKVSKAKAGKKHRNPPQSPHVHQ